MLHPTHPSIIRHPRTTKQQNPHIRGLLTTRLWWATAWKDTLIGVRNPAWRASGCPVTPVSSSPNEKQPPQDAEPGGYWPE
jgi:hypothetical protein